MSVASETGSLLVALAMWLTRDVALRTVFEISTREPVTGLQAQAADTRYRGSQGLDPKFIKELEKQYGFDKPALARYCDAMRALAKELNVPLVDVHEAFLARQPDKLLLDGMHPNDSGHAIIAELLVPVIREQLR